MKKQTGRDFEINKKVCLSDFPAGPGPGNAVKGHSGDKAAKKWGRSTIREDRPLVLLFFYEQAADAFAHLIVCCVIRREELGVFLGENGPRVG